MPHTFLLRLVGLALAMSGIRGADLPIVHVTIGPDGAVVERAGQLPPGDEVVSGLPVGIDPERISLTIDGLDTPPAIRIIPPALQPIMPPDAATQMRINQAQAAFDGAQQTIDLADVRRRLARSVLRLFPERSAGVHDLPWPTQDGGTPPVAATLERPPTTTVPVLSAVDQQAVLHFVATNLTRAENDMGAARRSRLDARAQLIALDEEQERLRPAPQLSARMPLPGAGGRTVHIRYPVERSSWSPVYRIEAVAGHVVLVREALIDVPRDQDWSTGQLDLVTRLPGDDLILRDLQVPVLELSDEVVVDATRMGLRVIAKGGGMMAREGVVDVNLRRAKQRQDADGSWHAGTWTQHATALSLLCFMGAGYDQMTPSRYKTVIAAGLDWLSHHDSCPDLAGQALGVLALSEACAMTNDQQLKSVAEHAFSLLAERVVDAHELDSSIYHRGPMTGPQVMAWVTMATRSAMAGGIGEAKCQKIMGVIQGLIPELDGHSNRDEAMVTHLLVTLLVNHRQGSAMQAPPVSEWLNRLPSWIQQGRPELAYFATIGLFQYGGNAWALWNAAMRDHFIAICAAVERSGTMAASPSVIGDDAALALNCLPLEIYYRYRRVSNGVGDSGASRITASALTIPELPPLPDLVTQARHWPVCFAAGQAHLPEGQRARVLLGRTELPGRISLMAVPADGDGAWRLLATTNPLQIPILAGPADVLVDDERIGTVELPFTEPGLAMNLALGRDDRIQVSRAVDHTDDEAWGKRTRTVSVRLRIDGPVGLYDSIRIDEAMPVPRDGSIQMVSVAPAIAPDALDRRLVEDPVWHLDLDIRKPPVLGQITWQLRYPATVRPKLELNQGAASATGAATGAATAPATPIESPKDQP